MCHVDPSLGNARNTRTQQYNRSRKRGFLCRSRISIAIKRANKHTFLTAEESVFRRVRAKQLSWKTMTLQESVEMRVQVWIVNQRATEAEESPVLGLVARKRPVKTVQRNSHCGEQILSKE
jgi:hypothetical protein